MINKVTLIGNVGNDPDTKTLENGTMVSGFSLATDEGYKDQKGDWVDRVEWHSVTAWRGTAERIDKSVKKGMLVYVEGKLSTRKWQDKDGSDRYKTEVVASYFRVLNSRDQPQTTTKPQPAPVSENGQDSEDDDLPF